MLLSMTGFGESLGEAEDFTCRLELRSVNNRFLKIISKLPESHIGLEARLEKTIRQKLRRGTISLHLRIEWSRPRWNYRLNAEVLQSYLSQLQTVGVKNEAVVGHVLALPGVVEEFSSTAECEDDWATIHQTLLGALESLDQMRREEGRAMQKELLSRHGRMLEITGQIEELAPRAVEEYRNRLKERVEKLLAEFETSIDPSSLIKEVSIFAERSDIVEEITRLRSHLGQMLEVIGGEESSGRKLDFLSQEMYRESNTIASKANNARISQLAVELKSDVESVREIIQNVE